MYTYSFEKLEVWKESKDLAISIYKITSKFPRNEQFGLTSQLRRASVSIYSNIAEGSARKTNKDKAHFTTMSFSSAVEVLSQIILAKELDFISQKEYETCRSKIESITNKLNALRTHQITKLTN